MSWSKDKFPFDAGPNFFLWLGFAIGSSFTLLAGSIIFAAFGQAMWVAIYDKLLEWQTLLSGVFALLAARLTVVAIKDQSMQESRRISDQLAREQFAAKTALPAGLVQLSNYNDACLKSLASLASMFDNDHRFLPPKAFRPPAIPDAPMGAIVLIEKALTSANSSNRDALAWVLRQFQVVNSRLNSVRNLSDESAQSAFIRINWVTHVVDVLEFKERANHLYPYARGEVDDIDTSISAHEMSMGLFRVDISCQSIPFLEDEMKRRIETPTNR